MLFILVYSHKGEEDKRKVLEDVKFNTSFRGSDLWNLGRVIVIVSVGLHLNSKNKS
jgi:hypothetical protein